MAKRNQGFTDFETGQGVGKRMGGMNTGKDSLNTRHAVHAAMMLILVLALGYPSAAQLNEPPRSLKNLSESERAALADKLYREQLKYSEGDPRRRTIKVIAQTAQTLRWCYLGKFGEIIVMAHDYPLQDGLLSVVRDDSGKGLQILENGERLGNVLYRVESDGQVLPKKSDDNSTDSRGELVWPLSKSGELELPTAQCFIVPRKSKSKPTRPRKPRGAKVWFFLDQDGTLHAPQDPDATPIPNCIWAVSGHNGSIKLEHAGPELKGTYCTIGVDLQLRFEAPSDNPESSSDCIWPFKTTSDRPALFTYPWRLDSKCYQTPEYLILDDGEICHLEPPAYAH